MSEPRDGAREALRERVAREIMGWSDARVPWAYTGEALLWHDDEGTALLACDSWRPDADDRQAMLVLDRMRALGFDYVLGGSAEGAYAQFGSHGAASGRAEDTDRRVALLRAALEAVTTAAQGA